MNIAVEVKDVSVKYQTQSDEIIAVSNITFNVFEEEFVSIVGPSGCGKSTLLSCIAGLVTPSSGTIKVYGRPPVTDGSVGYMLQRDTLFSWRNAFKNMKLGPEITGGGMDEKGIDELINKYHLTDFKYKYPDEISGGMRQRVALIRTLALTPKLLLLDEAFSGLDAQTRSKVSDDILKIIKSEKKTAVMVTHDITESILMSDRVIVLTDRPSTVRRIVDINFEPSLSSMEKRNCREFNYYYELIGKELKRYERDIP